MPPSPASESSSGALLVGLIGAVWLSSSTVHYAALTLHAAPVLFFAALSTAHTGMWCFEVYGQLVDAAGVDPGAPSWVLTAHLAILTTLATVAHAYFTARLARLYSGRRRVALVGSVALLAAAQLAFGIAATYYSRHAPPASLFVADLGTTYGWALLASSLAALLANTLTCAALIADMRCSGRFAARDETVVEVSVRLVLESNLATALVSIVALAFYVAWTAQGEGSGVFLALSIVLPKLYLLSVLASLERGADLVHSGLSRTRIVKHASSLSDMFKGAPLGSRRGSSSAAAAQAQAQGTPIADLYAAGAGAGGGGGTGRGRDEVGWLRRTLQPSSADSATPTPLCALAYPPAGFEFELADQPQHHQQQRQQGPRPTTGISPSDYGAWLDDDERGGAEAGYAGSAAAGAPAQAQGDGWASGVELAGTPTPRKSTFGHAQLGEPSHEGQGGSRDGPALLPALLAHLPTTPTFPLDCTSTHLAGPSPSHRFLPTDLALSLSLSLSSSPKRPSSLDPTARLKKRKLRHAFLRSDLLLAGPAPAPRPASSSPAAAAAAAAHNDDNDRPPRRPRTASTHAPWWPSVSRSHGEGTPSRFAREGRPEAHECGSGEGWQVAVKQLVGRFGALGVGEDEEMEKEKEKERERSRSRSRGRSRERGGARGRGRGGGRGGAREAGAAAGGLGGPVRPGMPARAASSPAVFGASGLRTAYEAPSHVPAQEQHVELSGPALKKALLLNLRARMASDGGTSKGAEAGLRFKKWVVWNAWRTRAHEPQPQAQVVDAQLDASSAAASSSDYSLVGFADDSGDLLGGGGGGATDNDGELLLGDVDLFLLPLPDPDDDDDALPSPPPPLEYAPPAEQSDGLVDEPVATVAPLSLLLVPPPPPGPPTEDGDEARSAPPPPVARPPMRRTASLPNVNVNVGDEDRRTQQGPRVGTWEVGRAAVVACEG
ncbi:hypothetical protein JCM9279_003587 [Rhodotorula babjevae]